MKKRKGAAAAVFVGSYDTPTATPSDGPAGGLRRGRKRKAPQELTQEQNVRMELNKQEALRRREALKQRAAEQQDTALGQSASDSDQSIPPFQSHINGSPNIPIPSLVGPQSIPDILRSNLAGHQSTPDILSSNLSISQPIPTSHSQTNSSPKMLSPNLGGPSSHKVAMEKIYRPSEQEAEEILEVLAELRTPSDALGGASLSNDDPDPKAMDLELKESENLQEGSVIVNVSLFPDNLQCQNPQYCLLLVLEAVY